MPWTQISFEIDSGDSARAEAALESVAARSITLCDPGGIPVLEPAPGENPLWPRLVIQALFDPGVDVMRARCAVTGALGAEPRGWTVETVADRVWERAWMDTFRPMRFGARLWIVPSTHEPPRPEAVNIRLDPGLAFGTGTHPTTALCLEWLDAHPPDNDTVVDYGCGSGVLAVAALRLGARRVHGLDIDPQALAASRENARRNGVADGLLLTSAEEAPVAADLVLANILAGVLVAQAATLTDCVRPGGWLVLSGILAAQTDTVHRAFEPSFDLQTTGQREGWVLMSGRRRGADRP